MNYSPSPKRLTRSRDDRMLAGVCGGVAEYLNMDPTLVRVLVAAIALFTGFFPVVVVYLIMMLVLPEAKRTPPSSIGYQSSGHHPGAYTSGYQASSYRQPADDPVWGAAGPPWKQRGNAESTEPAPRPSAEDLFSRAKHPTQPSQQPKQDDPEQKSTDDS
jgi:phage shock protein C